MIGMPMEAEAIAPKRELYGYITETGERAKRGMGFLEMGDGNAATLAAKASDMCKGIV